MRKLNRYGGMKGKLHEPFFGDLVFYDKPVSKVSKFLPPANHPCDPSQINEVFPYIVIVESLF